MTQNVKPHHVALIVLAFVAVLYAYVHKYHYDDMTNKEKVKQIFENNINTM